MKILLVIHPHKLIKRPFGQDGNFSVSFMMLDVIEFAFRSSLGIFGGLNLAKIMKL